MNEQTKTTETPIAGYLAVSGSALIAQFMGLKRTDKTNGEPTYFGEEKGTVIWESKLKYESSWDWLMPVVEKICRMKVGDGKEFITYAYPQTFGMLNEETGEIMVRLNGSFLFQSDTLISATYGAVVDFIQWWSKQADR